MANWRKVSGLPLTDLRLLIEAGGRLGAAWCALRLFPFERLVSAFKADPNATTLTLEQIKQIRWAVQTAARNLPVSLTCLPQALAASAMIRARGAAPRLFYGVTTTAEGGYAAHAWVEANGAPVVGHQGSDQFRVLATFPPLLQEGLSQ